IRGSSPLRGAGVFHGVKYPKSTQKSKCKKQKFGMPDKTLGAGPRACVRSQIVSLEPVKLPKVAKYAVEIAEK
ncbi:MAG: hypothetical protein ACYSTG_10250, partial [Planctomycetota bacterium]